MAELIAGDDGDGIANSLVGALRSVVDVDAVCILAFPVDAEPKVLFHNLDAEGAQHYLDRYLAGPYFLDPLYQLAIRDSKPGVCRYRDEKPDRFHSSEYYRQYCERTHLKDEIDYLVPVDNDVTVAMVVAKLTKPFTAAEVQRMHQVEAIVHAAITNMWRIRHDNDGSDRGNGGFHRRLSRCFENFGEDLLTQREREITQLLLRGFSTKAIARRLDIAPGTVMVHKRNLFSKLSITSQYELFSRFVDALSDA